ncbi:MAG: leucine zipper domain-containing protein [Actinomycetota bacterium]
MSHPRATITAQGRQLLVERAPGSGWTVPMAAEAEGSLPATADKWIRRFLAEGLEGLTDRSSRPHHSPAR